jgi:SAM-dependent methyltransferase
VDATGLATDGQADAMSAGSVLRRLRGRPAVARVLWRAHDLFVLPLRAINSFLRRITATSHGLQYKVEGFLRPSAEWFDHEVDAHWQWPAQGRATFLERGVLNSLAIRPGGEILELCCGDGFNTSRFYAARAARVLAIDHNEQALVHARRHHARPNVEYRLGDIRGELPRGPFDNVIWDSAIHHFTLADAASVLSAVHGVLRHGGLLSGYTEIEPDDSYAYTLTHFSDPEGLATLLSGEFAHVAVIETPDPLRRNLYFFAADDLSALPFAEGVRAAQEPPPFP